MKENNPVFSLSDQAQCLRREVRMRYGVYPGRVAAEKMTQADMDREIGQMEAAADTVEKMAKNGMFRELYNVVKAAHGQSLEQLQKEVERFTDQLLFAPGLANPKEVALKVAGLTLRWAELLSEAAAKPQADATPEAPAPALVPPAPSATAALANSAPPREALATPAQKEQILSLINNVAVPRNEKTKVLLNINRLTAETAPALIAKLQGIIEQHEGPVTYRKAS